MTQLNAGQLVRVTSPGSLAYGRIAMVLTVHKGVQVRFADLPKSAASLNPAELTQTFKAEELKPIKGVPVASYYLLVTVETIVGAQAYTRYAIAHGQEGEKAYDVAETVAAKFFGSLGNWDGGFYLWEASPYAARLDGFERITIAQYIELSRTTPDYDLGSDVPRVPF